MSTTEITPNVGQSVRMSDVKRIADIAATMDDRVLELLTTALGIEKRILPLFEFGISPSYLIVGHDVDSGMGNGKVRLNPAHFIQSVPENAYALALSAKTNVVIDSPTFGANSSGSTRYDLLYAAISYGTPTNESVRQKPTAGSSPQTATLTTRKDLLITLGIVAGVASGNPLGSLPSDTGTDMTGSFNFGLVMVAVPNGFNPASSTINQSTITPLWGRATMQPQRMRQLEAMSLYSDGASAERPGGPMQAQVVGAERWGGLRKFFLHFLLKTTTPDVASNVGTIIDDTIDWRRRLLWLDVGVIDRVDFAESAVAIEALVKPRASFPEPVDPPNFGRFMYFSGNGGFAAGSLPQLAYVASGGVIFQVDTNGKLRVCRNPGHGAPLDAVNGDLIVVKIEVSEQFTSNPY